MPPVFDRDAAIVRVFVYEDVTGGGFLNVALPPALAREGETMVRALLADLIAIDGIDAFTSLDPRLPSLDLPVECVVAKDEECFAQCVLRADAVWPVAPETEGRLEHLSRRVLALDRVLLGSRPDAVRIAASKWCTSQALRAAHIPCVATFKPDDVLDEPDEGGAWVVKPDDGAGCQDTGLFANRDAAARWACARCGFVMQRFITGEARSLSMLCRDGEAALLSCNRQRVIIGDGRIELVGVEVDAVRDRGELVDLAGSVAAAIPGLWGYVGVDFVQTHRGAIVLEINPRLTTSYAGLSAAAGSNVAALVLDLLDSARPLPPAIVSEFAAGFETLAG